MSRLLAVAVFAAASLVACGDDDGPGRAGFIEAADRICEDHEVAVSELAAADGLDDARQAGERVASAGRRQLSRLRALDPPADDEEEVDALLAAIGDGVRLAGEVARAADAGDEAEVARLTAQGSQLAAEIRERAHRFGFEACGGAGEPLPARSDQRAAARARFISEADALCADASLAAAALPDPESDPELIEFLVELERVTGDVIELLRELEVPPGDEAAVSRLLRTREQVHEAVGGALEAARDGDLEEVQEAADELDRRQREQADAWDAYGADECGSGTQG